MNKFGFIAHPIDSKTFYDFLGAWSTIAKYLPQSIVKTAVLNLPPYKLCSFDRIRSSQNIEISGSTITLPIMPSQIVSMPEGKALSMIEKAIKICEKEKAKIVGLGGFASVVGNEGEALSKRVSVPLTSGNTLTSSLALDGIYKAAYLMDINLAEATAAVIGATGDIGSICTKVLSKKVKKLNIAARNEKRLQDFAELISNYGNAQVEVFKYTKDAVRTADIVLTATSAVTTIVDAGNLKPGAIVCDVAIPANIAKEVVKTRDDILVFEGGLAKFPYPEDVYNKKLANLVPQNSMYGCVAETISLTLEEKFEPYSIGRGNITEEKLYRIKNISEKHGLTLSDFFCGYKFFTEEDIKNIRKNAERKKEEYYVTER